MPETRAAEVENVETVAGDPAETPRERDTRGRFAKGHKYQPRKFPKGAAVSDYRSGWLDNVTPQEFSNVVSVVLARAKQGDLRACEMLFDRLWPSISVSLGLDGDDFRVAGIAPDELDREMLGRLFEAIEKRKAMAEQVAAEQTRLAAPRTVVNSVTDTRGQVSADLTEEAETAAFPGFPAE